MKISIQDGCANGGMMDSLSIGKYEDGDEPYAVAEVLPEKWEEWQAFLKIQGQWEKFWTQLLLNKQNRHKAK